MKTFSQTFLGLLLLLGWIALFPSAGRASEARVDSTGGLTTILDDETDNLDLFLDGNPAGLVLLNTRDRFDLAGEWSYSDKEGPWGSDKRQVLSTIPRSTDNPVKYEGLMLFPDPHWAVQVAGDALVNQGVPSSLYSNDTETDFQYRGILRAAYALPALSLGLEILDMESDNRFDPGLYNPYVGIASGSAAQNQLLLKSGFIATFPERTSPQDPRWQAGGYFEAQLGSAALDKTLDVFYNGSPSFPVRQTDSTADFTRWGAELLYELPSVAKLRLTASLVNSDDDFEQSVPAASAYFGNLPRYRSSRFQSVDVAAAFKLNLPFSDADNLKIGGSLDGFFSNQDILRVDGSVSSNNQRDQVGTSFGIGLENPKEYTMGVQWKSLSHAKAGDAVNVAGTSASLSGTDYAYYQVAFGGEKWISSTWAFRLGLVGEVDDDSATSISSLTTTINAGAGVEEVFGRVDFRLWLGQAGDLNNQANTQGLIGTQVSATIFL
ncbi:MAG TPA: hypothetical protein VJ873_05565 [bacterium]|nr:hypothetical protein [bacterium]